MVDIIKDRLFTPEQAAAHFGVSRTTIYRWLNNGLESARMGGRRYTTAEALQRFAQQEANKEVSVVAHQPNRDAIVQAIRERC